MNTRESIELDDRTIAAIVEENTGTRYKRQHAIADRALDAKYLAAEKDFVLCDFKNKYGWCKLEQGHQGSHTVVWLGGD